MEELKLYSFEGLAELPIGGHDIVAGDGPAVAGGDLEGEALAIEIRVALPVLAPVPGHDLPPGPGALDGDRTHVAGARHVGDQDQVEVGVAIDGEPDPSFLRAWHPAKEASMDVSYRHDPSPVLSDLQKRRLGHVEVRAGRIAPPSIVAGKSLVTRPAAQPVVEKGRAQGGGVCAVTLTVEIAIPASTSYMTKSNPCLRANEIAVIIVRGWDEIAEATAIIVMVGGQRWSLLRGKKSYGGAIGMRSSRMLRSLPRLEGSDGRCCAEGDNIAKEEDDNVGSSKDDASAAMTEEGDGSTRAPWAKGNDGIEGDDDIEEGEGIVVVGSNNIDDGWTTTFSASRGQGVGSQRVTITTQEGDGSGDDKGGVRLWWTMEKGQGDGSAGCLASEAVLQWLLRLLQSSWCHDKGGQRLRDDAVTGLCEVAARSRRRSCSGD
ncbi:hypothetical protein BHM03_00051642 [Ensete ventricosum]|nr:hypothetical protein BHM03_00051642 [Ensete ventricosum]